MCLDYTLYAYRIEDGNNFLAETTRKSRTWEVCKEES